VKGLLAVIPVGALLCAVRMDAQQAPAAVSPRQPAVSREVGRARPAAYAAPAMAPLEMGPLSAAERRLRPLRGLRQTGVRRTLPAAAIESATTGVYTAGRLAWRLTLRSEGAVAVRVHFRGFSVGEGQVWLYAPPDGATGAARAAGPYSGKGPYGDGEFWSASVFSDTVVVEYDAPTGAASAAPPFTVDAISHRWAAEAQPAAVNGAAPCELDVTCYPAYADAASGVVTYDFTSGGGFYDCSGAMINTLNSSFIPYLLTANHCVANETEARTVEAFFLYQTATCNGTPPSLATVPQVSGAHFAAGADVTQGDYTLLLLEGPAPEGVHFLGWNVDGPAIGNPATGIHHPEGSWKRISFGNRTMDETLNVEGQIAPANRYYQIDYREGRIEPGSSGSPLLNAANQIVGTATAAPVIPLHQTVCDVSPFTATYGRFSVAYPALQTFLSGEALPSLSATPTSLSFTETDGVLTGAANQMLTIQSSSAQAATFTAAAADSWVLLSSTSGTVSSAAAATLGVTVDTSALPQPGVYTSSITVSAGILTPVTIPVQFTITATRSRVVASLDRDRVYAQTPDADGYAWFYSIRLTEVSGFATRLTRVRFNGDDVTASVLPLFVSGDIPAFGSIEAHLRARGIVPPQTGDYEFSGEDAGGRTWTVNQSVSFGGQRVLAQLALTVIPSPLRQNISMLGCPWLEYIIVREQAGLAVNLNRLTVGTQDLSLNVAGYFFGAGQVPGNGAILGEVCLGSINPGVVNTTVGGMDTFGNSVSASVATTFAGPATPMTPFNLTPRSLALSSTERTADLTIDLGSTSLFWRVEAVQPRAGNSWLSLYPLSGAGSGTVTVVADPTGLALGTYTARLVVSAGDATPQEYVVEVTFQVTNADPEISAGGLVNAASYQAALAPGTIATLFGTRLASGTAAATAFPLPTSLLGTSALLGATPVPFFFVSPGQANLMIPSGTAPGTAAFTLTTSGGSVFQDVTIAAAAPGLFSLDQSGSGQGAIQIKDSPMLAAAEGSVPGRESRPARRGVDSVSIFCTGLGVVTNPPAPGAAAPGNPLSATVATPRVIIGGRAATVTFWGLAPGFTGLYQIDARVPAGTAVGDAVPVSVTISGAASNTVTMAVR
jgi:uncharacterized protein (TIGR03437 family)